jgi:hypothetical protein
MYTDRDASSSISSSLPQGLSPSGEPEVTSTSSNIGLSSEAAIDKVINFARSSKVMGRQNESAEARERRIIADRERKRLARQKENAEARERRMIADKERKRLMRGLETPEQKRLRRELQKKRRMEREHGKGECSETADVAGCDDMDMDCNSCADDRPDASIVVANIPATTDAEALLSVSHNPHAPLVSKPLLSVAQVAADAASVPLKSQAAAVFNLPSLNDLLTSGSAVAPALEVIVPAGIDLSAPDMVGAAKKPHLPTKTSPVCIVANEALPSSLGHPPLFLSSASVSQAAAKAPPSAGIIFDGIRTDPLFTV